MAARLLETLSFGRAPGIFGIVGKLNNSPSLPRLSRNFNSLVMCCAQSRPEKLLVVVGGGAAGVFGAIRAKDVAPHLRVVVIEQGKLLSKVKVSGGGRCNVTNGHHVDGKGFNIATQLGHSVVQPMPSLFTFKIEDKRLLDLAGVTFPKVKATLRIQNVHSIPQFVQVGPMLVTHWGLSGPVILRLSAWGARDLFCSNYKGILLVDFVPDSRVDDVISILTQHKTLFAKQKVLNSCPIQLGLVKRFWKYLVEREGIDEDVLWASVPKKTLSSIALLMKQCSFTIVGKGQFKDEFVTAGGVTLTEINLSTMESRMQPGLFLAGEVLNVDGVTGGFNFQNAWSGAYIAGTTIGKLASVVLCD